MFFSLSLYSQSNYTDTYQEESESAISYFENAYQFKDLCIGEQLSYPFLFSIVAPEIANYWQLQDIAEITSLKVLYVQGGEDYGDFSIGKFQMKPSFIVEMEEYTRQDSLLYSKFKAIVEYDVSLDKELRRQRINRLSNEYWQIQYLILFYQIMESQFSYLDFDSSEHKLEFYASAYNLGFNRSESAIINWIEMEAFPASIYKRKFSYAKSAGAFYNHIISNNINPTETNFQPK